MKLPIQAQPVRRKVSSAMLAEKATNTVSASSACNAQCGWAAAKCAVSIIGGPKAVGACLASVGGSHCFDCVMEILDPANWGGRSGGGRPDPGAF